MGEGPEGGEVRGPSRPGRRTRRRRGGKGRDPGLRQALRGSSPGCWAVPARDRPRASRSHGNLTKVHTAQMPAWAPRTPGRPLLLLLRPLPRPLPTTGTQGLPRSPR